MKNTFKYLMIIFLGLSLNSCYYDSEYEEIVADNGGDNGGDTPTELTFTADIAPILSWCSSCHNGSRNPDLREGFAYDALVPDYVTANDAQDSELYIILQNNHQGGVGDDLATIKAWIDQGAIE